MPRCKILSEKYFTIKLSFLSLIACLLFSILTVKTSFAETEVEKEIERINKEGVKLYQEGKYGEALPLFEKLVEFRRNNLGEEHPDYATSLNDLASLYHSMAFSTTSLRRAGLTSFPRQHPSISPYPDSNPLPIVLTEYSPSPTP